MSEKPICPLRSCWKHASGMTHARPRCRPVAMGRAPKPFTFSAVRDCLYVGAGAGNTANGHLS